MEGGRAMDAVVVEPADTPYVALSAALTWIAFRHALDASELRAAVVGVPVIDGRTNDERLRDFFSPDATEPAAYADHDHAAFHDREAGLARLEDAWVAVRAEVDRGCLEVRGRYTPAYSVSQAQLAVPEVLAGSRLAAFSQFDPSTGGIRRQPSGQPTVIWEGHPLAYEREWASAAGDDRAKDGYLMVEVRRDHLMAVFPPCAAPIDSTIAVTSTTGAENECRAWLENQFAADPNTQRSKDDFRTAALTHFNGRLSARGFNNRVWPALAQQHGRTSPGAKRKS